MWRLHQKNVNLALKDIKGEEVFLVIWKKGIRFMSTDGHFKRYLSSAGYHDHPQHEPAICLLATKSEVLKTDLIFIHEKLVSAGVLAHRLPIPVSLAIYEQKIDILGANAEDAISEIKMALDANDKSKEQENLPSNTGCVAHKSTQEE